MPTRFDDAAADAVLHQLDLATKAMLDMDVRIRVLRSSTTDQWQGRFRHTFEEEVRVQLGLLHQLIADTYLMAVDVRSLQLEARARRLAEQQAQEATPALANGASSFTVRAPG